MLVGRRSYTKFNPDIAIEICRRVMDGESIVKILKEPGMPVRSTWYNWLLLYPDVLKMYDAAREMSALSLEEEMGDIKDKLLDEQTLVPKAMLDRYHEALVHLRWLAGKRDPRRFGEQKSPTLVVPIQINTSLDMGDGRGTSIPTITTENVYTLEAQPVPATLPPEPDDEPPALLPPKPQRLFPDPPSDRPRAKPGPKPGKGKHKTAGQLRATLLSHAKRRKHEREREVTDGLAVSIDGDGEPDRG